MTLGNAVDRLVSLGTRPHYSPKKNQVIRLINKVGSIYIAVVLPNIVLTAVYGSIAATTEQILGVSAMCLTIYLNSRDRYKIARALTLVIGNLHIFSLSLILGMEGAAHYYFPAALVAPLFFYSPREFRIILSFCLTTVVLTVLAHVLNPVLDYASLASGTLLRLFFISSLFGSQGVIFLFVLHFYKESHRFEKSLEAVNNKLLKMSETDSLTQLPNKRSIIKNINREWGKGVRSGQPLAVVMMDVDHFKAYNDHYGHPEGDRCLEKIAGVLSADVRNYIDYPGRYGGEEFIVILTNTDLEAARDVSERIRIEVESLGIPHKGNEKEGVITCSLGVSSCVPDESIGYEDLIQAADRALYLAKTGGRNRVGVVRF